MFGKLSLLILGVAVAFSLLLAVELKLLRGTVLNPQLCPGTQPEDPKHIASCADPEIDKLVSSLDTHTLWLFNKFKSGFEADDPNTNIPTAKDVMKRPVPKKVYRKINIGVGFDTKSGEHYSLDIPSDDTEDWPGYEWSIMGRISTLLLSWLRIGLFHPLADLPLQWASPAQGKAALAAAVGHDVDQRLLVENDDHVTDDAIARWAYAGMAAHRLQCPGITGYKVHELTLEKTEVTPSEDEHCMLDMMWMNQLPVREGFESYGATVYFSADRKLTKIFWGHEKRMIFPGDEKWEHAKWVWKSSVLVGITFRDHLTNVHLMAANQLTIASREQLGENHPLRRLIKPFTYNTIGINIGASKTLAVKNSLVHRATSLTWEAYEEGFGLILDLDRVLPSPTPWMKLRGTDQLGADAYPFGEDWSDFWTVLHEFVGEYLDVYYADDEAVAADTELREFYKHIQLPESKNNKHPNKSVLNKLVLRHLLVDLFGAVTGIHNQVGNIAEYLIDPAYVSAKLIAGSELSDPQSAFQALNIALSTASKQPMLIGNMDHLMLDEQGKAVWGRFQEKLVGLAEEVEQRNGKRGAFKCNAMNPRKMVHSVAI